MDINQYRYVKNTEITGDIEIDVRKFLLQNNMQKTLEHIVAVANSNCKIAEKYGLDKKICTISAYLHDISAVIHPKDMLNYLLDNNLYIDEAERKYPTISHQRISKYLAKDYFGVKDVTILSAIECHSTLKSNPTDYDMALFIADKLSWDQGGTPPFYEIVSNSLASSLENACLTYINYMIDNNMIVYPHSWLIAGKKYLETVINVQSREIISKKTK